MMGVSGESETQRRWVAGRRGATEGVYQVEEGRIGTIQPLSRRLDAHDRRVLPDDQHAAVVIS